jgi:hypothetical protein
MEKQNASRSSEQQQQQRPHRVHFRYTGYVLRDALIFSVIGIVLGFLIDFIFPEPHTTESHALAFFYVILQIVIDAFIVFFISELYTMVFGQEADTYIGFSVFTVIFFLVQVQLLQRLNNLYTGITGTSFE